MQNEFSALAKKVLDSHQKWKDYRKSNVFVSPSQKGESQSKISAPKKESTGIFASLFGSSTTKSEVSVSDKSPTSTQRNSPLEYIPGIYLFGAPGCGKTYMMDLFYEMMPIQEKSRIHYNEFMLHVTNRMHKLNQVFYYRFTIVGKERRPVS